MQHSDLPAVLALQAACYPAALIESSATLSAKLALSPQSCWLAEDSHGPLAYLFAHPWTEGLPPPLDQPLTHLPQAASSFFLHDLALHPRARGRGLAQALVHDALRWARQRRHRGAQLVAIAGARAFWEKQGFTPCPQPTPALREKLADYGAGAEYLELSLPRPEDNA